MKSPTTPNNRVAGARRIADKQKRDAFNQLLSNLSADTVSKLRHDALVAANKRLLGSRASPEEVVREAQQHFEAHVRFLLDQGSAS